MTRYQLLKQYNYINAKFKIWAYSFRKFKLNDLWFIYINIFIFYLMSVYIYYRRIFIMGWYRFLGLTRIFSFSCQKFRPYIIRGKNWQEGAVFFYIFLTSFLSTFPFIWHVLICECEFLTRKLVNREICHFFGV